MIAHPLIPPVVSGYALTAKKGRFVFVKPESTENLIINPSMESNAGGLILGYTATVAALMNQNSNWQRRGLRSCEVILGNAAANGIYSEFSGAAGTPYTFSCDLLGAGGDSYLLYFETAAGINVSQIVEVKSRGRVQRPHVTFTARTTTTYRAWLIRKAGGSLRSFYTDGWQVEPKPYPTTYCDGSLRGFIPDRIDFYWRGTEHLSTSVRIGESRAGGRIIDPRTFGLEVLSYNGLGYGGIINYTTPLARGGAYFHGSNISDRQFTIVASLSGASGEELSERRNELIELLAFEQSTPDQPLTMYYSLEDCDFWDDEKLEIIAIHEGGTEGVVDNDYQERLPLNFRLLSKNTARRHGDVGLELEYQISVANANRGLKRDSDGVWSALSTGFAATSVRGYARLPDGRYICFGDFTQAGAVANTNGAALYDPITDTFTSIFNAAGFAGAGDVNDVVVAPDGFAYFGGAWTGVDGIADTANIAAWNYTTGLWSSVATPSSSSVVNSLHYAIDGSLFVGSASGGAGMTIGGIGPTTIAIRSAGGVWSATPVLNNFIVNDIKGALDGTVYASENVSGIYRWTGAAWVEITTDNPSASSLLFTPDGRMYFALQNSDTISGVDVNYCGYWNGTSVYPLGLGFNNNALRVTYSAQDKLIYYCGTYTTADGITLPDSASAWTGSAHIPLDVDLPGSGNVWQIFAPAPDYLLVGFSTGGTATAAAVNTIDNPGTANTYPVFTLTGPGRLFQIKNYTTGAAMYFNLTLLPGEVAILDLSTESGIRFYSNFRASLLGTIIKGSNTDLFLKPGVNKVSVFITGDTPGTTKASVVFRPAHNTIDGWAKERMLPLP